jgi:hypothetical protein
MCGDAAAVVVVVAVALVARSAEEEARVVDLVAALEAEPEAEAAFQLEERNRAAGVVTAVDMGAVQQPCRPCHVLP